LKERNSEGVNMLPRWSASLFFKLSNNSSVRQQKSKASAADSVVEPVSPAKGATRVAYEEGVGWVTLFGGLAGEGFL
jgi:hypothetical protein